MEMATERVRNGEHCQGMGAGLWGELQSHIDLEMVYVELPIGTSSGCVSSARSGTAWRPIEVS